MRRAARGANAFDRDPYDDHNDQPKNVQPDKLKSILRKIIMIGRLAEPVSCVYFYTSIND